MMPPELRDQLSRGGAIEVRVEPPEPRPLADGGDVRPPRDLRAPFRREEPVVDQRARVLEGVDAVRRGLAGGRRAEMARDGDPAAVPLPDRGPREGGRDVHVELEPVHPHPRLPGHLPCRAQGGAERPA